MPPDSFSIAQVTPYPWEDAHEVNAFVAELSAALEVGDQSPNHCVGVSDLRLVRR